LSVTRLLAVVAFAAAFLMALGLEWAARRPGSKVPTFAAVCGHAVRYRIGRMPVGRIAMFGFWWWLGWHFLAR
jgi:membrane-associated protease RseP (regulator of RpoE activity)